MRTLYNSPRKTLRGLLAFSLIAGLMLSGLQFLIPIKAKALTGAEFQPGNIISDGIFFNGNDMDATTIQTFLNSKVPTCDSNGTQAYAGTTRAAYGASKGYPAPYVCLKDYRQDVPEKPAEDGLCTGIGAGNKSAAQIIYEIGVSCGINQKALIVLLQKEQGLITDDWPWPTQYNKATGFGCPDTAACNTKYYGLFNQLYLAARQFKKYALFPDSYNYTAKQNNSIKWRPDFAVNDAQGNFLRWEDRCGSSSVFIENQATAGLYNYTPYRPNAAALSGLSDTSPGGGDTCSAYGNRNFWWYFNRWFGSTQIPVGCTGNESPLPYVIRYYHPRTYMHFYSAYQCDGTFLKWLGYVDEGPSFNTTSSSAPWSVPVYRYYNPQTGLHVWTTKNLTQAELIAGGTGYRQEAGIVFYVIRQDMPNVHPIRQFYNPKTYIHLLIPDPTPQDILFLKDRAGFDIEDVAFYAQ